MTQPTETPPAETPSTEPQANGKRPNVSYPLRTKIVIVAVLAVAIGGFVLAGLRADTDNDDGVTVTGEEPQVTQATIANGIEAIRPGRGTEVFAQQRIELDLAPGWNGELVLQPASGDAIPLPEDEVEFTSSNQLIYEPGPGKTIERLPSGQVCVRATIWDQVRGRPATERVESWCFDVT